MVANMKAQVTSKEVPFLFTEAVSLFFFFFPLRLGKKTVGKEGEGRQVS